MYTDEKMKLRADCFRALQHHLDENCGEVYEFCHQWILGGNTDIEDVEISLFASLQSSSVSCHYVLSRRGKNGETEKSNK